MDHFVYTSHPARIVFGHGALARTASELKTMNISRVAVVTTPDQESDGRALAHDLGDHVGLRLALAEMHTPVEVTAKALDACRAAEIDGIVSLGGGSTIGLGKALAFRMKLPHLAIPTTYAGSEVTPVLGETKDGIKTTMSDPAIRPNTVIYDPDLTATLPFSLKVTSGFNAIAHAAEALYSKDRNPIIDLMAISGIGAVIQGLTVLSKDTDDIQQDYDLLYGAWLCGTCLGSVGMSLHHKLCHAIGGRYNLNHAAMHTAILPHAIGFCLEAAPHAKSLLSIALDSTDPAARLFEIATDLGATMALANLGFPEDGADSVADAVLAAPYYIPRAVDKAALISLLNAARTGAYPKATRSCAVVTKV